MYCRVRVSPRLTVDACESLRNQFVSIREDHRKKVRDGSVIPITVRQLEAIVRLSESLARMSCTPDVTDVHVREALRLFRVSTLDAASTGLDIDGSTVSDPDFISKVRFIACCRLHLKPILRVVGETCNTWTCRLRMQRSGYVGAWLSVLLFPSVFLWKRLAARCAAAVAAALPKNLLLTLTLQGMQPNHVRKALQVMLNRGQLVVRAQGNLLTRSR